MAGFIDLDQLTIRIWWVCPKCRKRNWLGRKTDPERCSKCENKLVKHSSWTDKARKWIFGRDRRCVIGQYHDVILKEYDLEVGECSGGSLYAVHLLSRKDGGDVDDPENGAAMCLRHADWWITGRLRAREEYARIKSAFADWYLEHLHLSFSRLPQKLKMAHTYIMGVIKERSRIQRIIDEKRAKAK